MVIRIILLIVTFVTTCLVGHSTSNTELYPYAGLWYSLPLMGILLGHEMGHYFTCRYYGVRATLPIFIPMPMPPFGTLGALIVMRSPMPHRRAIFDIGLAGPLVGFLLSLPAVIIGLHMSKAVDGTELVRYYLTHKLWLCSVGESQLFHWFERLMVGDIPPHMALDFHPLAMAGWVGLFVTALNLLPVGQLDGGHILYGLFGRKSIRISNAVVGGALLALVVAYQLMWQYTVFMVLVFLLSFRFPHPPPLDDVDPIGPNRKLLGAVALLVMILSFTPHPFDIQDRDAMRDTMQQLEEHEQERPRWTPEDLKKWAVKT